MDIKSLSPVIGCEERFGQRPSNHIPHAGGMPQSKGVLALHVRRWDALVGRYRAGGEHRALELEGSVKLRRLRVLRLERGTGAERRASARAVRRSSGRAGGADREGTSEKWEGRCAGARAATHPPPSAWQTEQETEAASQGRRAGGWQGGKPLQTSLACGAATDPTRRHGRDAPAGLQANPVKTRERNATLRPEGGCGWRRTVGVRAPRGWQRSTTAGNEVYTSMYYDAAVCWRPQPLSRRVARTLLLLEVIVNLAAGPAMVFVPELVLSAFFDPHEGRRPPIDPLAAEAQRWFGVICFVFGGILLGLTLFGERSGCLSTQQPWEAVRLLLQVFMVGDVLYVGAFARWCIVRKFWNVACVFNVAFGMALPIARLVVLADTASLGYEPCRKTRRLE